MAQVTFVATATATTDLGGSIQIGKPTGTTDGDILIAQLSYIGTMTVTLLSGWTEINTYNTTIHSSFYYKLASSEPSTYTWVETGATNFVVQGSITAWRGARTTTPVVSIASLLNGSGTSAPGTAITPVCAPGAVVCGYVFASALLGTVSGYSIVNNNPTWTEAFDVNFDATGSDGTGSMAYGNYDFITTTGAFASTLSSAATSRVTLLSIRIPDPVIEPPVLTIADTIPVPVVDMAFAPPTLETDTSFPVPSVAEGTPKWVNTSKNSGTWINQNKS